MLPVAKSIISNDPKCFVCGCPYKLHRHHLYGGVGRRDKSEEYGCWVYLCARHHNLSNSGVHYYKPLDDKLKKLCQEEWEKRFGSTEDFIRIFGRNYL